MDELVKKCSSRMIRIEIASITCCGIFWNNVYQSKPFSTRDQQKKEKKHNWRRNNQLKLLKIKIFPLHSTISFFLIFTNITFIFYQIICSKRKWRTWKFSPLHINMCLLYAEAIISLIKLTLSINELKRSIGDIYLHD